MPHPIIRFFFFVFSLSCISVVAQGENATFETTTKLSSNLRWTLDFSSLAVFNDNDSFTQNMIGLDIHKVFSNENGDIGTLVFQPYWVNFDNKQSTPYFFDGKDTELTWRIANFNLTTLSKGGFNIRLGHFEVPFGLEQNIDTNGTTRQYSFADRGIKADWGTSINGVLPSFDYELAVMRGSGNDYTTRDDPYIVAGRIGTPSHQNLVIGLSFFKGEILDASGTTKRERIGLDMAWYRCNWELLFEVSAGNNEETQVANALAEVSWRNLDESFHSYLQIRHFQTEANDDEKGSALNLGLNFNITNRFIISSEWNKPIDQFGSQSEHSTFILQARYRL